MDGEMSNSEKESLIDRFVDIWWRLRIVKGILPDDEPDDHTLYDSLIRYWRRDGPKWK